MRLNGIRLLDPKYVFARLVWPCKYCNLINYFILTGSHGRNETIRTARGDSRLSFLTERYILFGRAGSDKNNTRTIFKKYREFTFYNTTEISV